MLRSALRLVTALSHLVFDFFAVWHFYRKSVLDIDRLMVKICVELIITAARCGQYV